jgi:hypothetical protein
MPAPKGCRRAGCRRSNQSQPRQSSLDEERQRANIVALKDADKSARDELNKTEDAINAAHCELPTRTAALDAAKIALANLIENLQIDTSV